MFTFLKAQLFVLTHCGCTGVISFDCLTHIWPTFCSASKAGIRYNRHKTDFWHDQLELNLSADQLPADRSGVFPFPKKFQSGWSAVFRTITDWLLNTDFDWQDDWMTMLRHGRTFPESRCHPVSSLHMHFDRVVKTPAADVRRFSAG